MATLKILFGSVALLWLVLGTGCRNPNSCNSPWRPFAQNAIIAPPATNSLNMSGQSGGYYNPSATAANPQGNVPANPQGNAPNSGWAPAPNNRPSNQPTGNGNFGFNGAPMGNQNFQTVTSSTHPACQWQTQLECAPHRHFNRMVPSTRLINEINRTAGLEVLWLVTPIQPIKVQRS